MLRHTQPTLDSRTVLPERRRLLLLALAGLPAALLSACGGPPPAAPLLAPAQFSPVDPIRLQAATLLYRDSYAPQLQPPHIEAQLPIALGDTAILWGQTRLRATGSGSNEARLTITRAAVTETALPRTSGLSGLFTRDQVSRVETDLIGELEIFGPPGGMRLGFAQAQVTRGRSLAEGITLNQRSLSLTELVNDTVIAFAQAMEAKIRSDLGRFVAGAGSG